MKALNLTPTIKGVMERLYQCNLNEMWTLYKGGTFSTSDVKQVILRDPDKFEPVNNGL